MHPGSRRAGALGLLIASPVLAVRFCFLGILCKGDFLGGWPSVFYVFGMLGIVWFAFWLKYAHDSPESHPTIDPAERRYIVNAIQTEQSGTGFMATPWARIFTSVPLWAIVVMHFANNWAFYTLLTMMPSYMKTILGVSISDNGLYSSYPYMSLFVVGISVGFLADYLRDGRLSTGAVRKILNSVAMVIFCVFVVLAGHATTIDTTVAFLTLAQGCSPPRFPLSSVVPLAPKTWMSGRQTCGFFHS